MPSKGIEQLHNMQHTQLCLYPDLGQAARSSNWIKLPRLADGRIPYAYGKRNRGTYWGEEKMREIDWEIVNCRHQNNLALIGR